MGFYYKEPKLTKCPGCGTEFYRKKWSDKKFCKPDCGGARLTDYDKKVLSDYRSICTRHNLSVHETFTQLTGHPWRYFYYLTQRLQTSRVKCGRYRPETKDRYIAIVKRIVDDFNAGKYEVVFKRMVWGFRSGPLNQLQRRLSPGRPECPMKLVHCAGGLYPGDCPRHWRECPLWSN